METRLKRLRESLEVSDNIQTLVDQFIEHGYSSRGHSKWTMRTRASHLKQFVSFCTMIGMTRLSDVNNLVIDAYFADFSQTRAKTTANTGRRIIKVFLNWVLEYKEQQVKARPEAIKLVKEPRPLPKAIDYDTIYDVTTRCPNPQDAMMIGVCYEAGLRISELVELRTYDIQGDAVHVRGKGAIDRTVYITDKLALHLRILARRRIEGDYLFQNDYGTWTGQMKVKTARSHMQKWFSEIAGIQMQPHQLRHSFAINLLQAGCDIVTIQHLLGHADITTTQVYLRVSNDYLKTEYKKYIGRSVL